MRPLSFLLAGAAMFVAALTVNAATVCQGKILNPVTDVCWSCVFPVKIGGKASLTTSVLPDPDTGAGGPFCTCGKFNFFQGRKLFPTNHWVNSVFVVKA